MNRIYSKSLYDIGVSTLRYYVVLRKNCLGYFVLDTLNSTSNQSKLKLCFGFTLRSASNDLASRDVEHVGRDAVACFRSQYMFLFAVNWTHDPKNTPGFLPTMTAYQRWGSSRTAGTLFGVMVKLITGISLQSTEGVWDVEGRSDARGQIKHVSIQSHWAASKRRTHEGERELCRLRSHEH